MTDPIIYDFLQQQHPDQTFFRLNIIQHLTVTHNTRIPTLIFIRINFFPTEHLHHNQIYTPKQKQPPKLFT